MIFAHGISSRGNLPLPLWMFTWAAAIALVVSFVALGLLWPKPRLARAASGRALGPASDRDGGAAASTGLFRGLELVGRVAALALFVLCLAAGWLGDDVVSDNILPVTLYVVVWVGGALVSGLIGDVWSRISPITTLARGLDRLSGRPAGQPAAAPPTWLNHWPAAAGLFVFLFHELIRPSAQQPRVLAQLLTVHLVMSLVAAWLWGADWVATHEPFAALFRFLGAMAPVFRADDGRLAVRPPMSGLARMPGVEPAPDGRRQWGTLAALLLVLGGTTFDGFTASPVGGRWFPKPTTWGDAAYTTLGFLGSVAVVAVIYAIGIAWTRRVTGMAMADAALAFTPSLVPIVFGYAIAHYALLLLDESQTFWFRLSDPFGRGWDLFGGSGGTINFTLVGVGTMAWIQMLAILFGHVGAIVVAHDRSIELFDASKSVRSQFAMLLVMVAYSTLGLWLLLKG